MTIIAVTVFPAPTVARCSTMPGGAWRSAPSKDAKPACNHCTVHCYSAKMKERVKAVMRYSGPRMLLRHPWLAILHLIDTRREAPDLPKRNRAKRNRRQDE